MSHESESRLPPHDRAAERAVLGCILHKDDALNDLATTLLPDDFYVWGHRAIYKAMLGLHAAGRAVDFINLGERLEGSRQLEDAGGHAYVSDLWDAAPGGFGDLSSYAETIKDRALRRELIRAANETQSNVWDLGTPAVELLQRGEKRLIDIGESRPASRLRDMREIGDDYLKELDRRCNQKRAGEVPDGSLSTGWSRLDALTGGLFGDELTIIAARPSKGKTLFACVMARSIAGRGFRVLVCSLEQTDREIYGRLIAAESGVKSHILRGGYVNDDQKERIIDARLRLDEVKILMDDSPAQSVMSIAATARRLLRSGGLNLVIVDYLGLLQPENRREPRHEQVGGMARHLKLLARELNIPVVALAQVGRSAENRTDQRPRLADLKESGGIEEHADCVMFLHKKEREEKEQPPPTEKIEVIVDKCRNGPTGFFFLIHDLAHFTVKEEAWPP